MQITNIHNAKTNFSKYLKQVAEGNEVIICSANKPIAKLVPYNHQSSPRSPGLLKDKIKIKDNYDVLPDEFLNFFGSRLAWS